ncbi:MAG: hypothetical protein ACI9ES_001557 [Oceanospirillaceae bacterium]|jgi:hypothetical protein
MSVWIINTAGLLLMAAIIWWFWLYPRQASIKLMADKKGTSNTPNNLDERDMEEESEKEERGKDRKEEKELADENQYRQDH